MTLLSIMQSACLASGLLLLIMCALHDVVSRTVPNGFVVLVGLFGVLGRYGCGDLILGVLVSFGVLVIAGLGWRRGWMGGADVKLLAAVALLVPPGSVPSLLAAIALSGGVLALVYLAARRRWPRSVGGFGVVGRAVGRGPLGLLRRALRAERWRLRRGGPMPYAVAIASGAVFVLWQGALP